MADEYKKEMHCRCGVGGLKCNCCNSYKGKDKPLLNRLVRRTLKHKDNKETKSS